MKRRSSKSARGAGANARARDVQRWQFQQIHAGVTELNGGRSVPHATVVSWLRSWGKRHERKAPRA
jgi:predicted transcriptional regulator